MSFEEQENHVNVDLLRAELKQWENAFRAANGKKPARADMKSDAMIAAKYKLYDQLMKRKVQTLPPPPPAATPKKRIRHSDSYGALRERPASYTEAPLTCTPKKTPSKRKLAPLQPPVLSPVQEVLPTPAFIRNALGPTPQKDGQVLGIFDIISTNTPAKDNLESQNKGSMVAGTPSKAAPSSSSITLSRTPQSVSKRYFLDAFAGTPLKRKREDDGGTHSSSKRQFATPSFLRRSFPLASINEENVETTSALPFKRRGLMRSLSSIIQGLKKTEEKRMDDEWDMLNEIEEEGQEERSGDKKKDQPKVLVEDSQPAEMPLGPDQGVESDESSEDERHGITRKPWKKKGLKRQTRRVIMRPVTHKAQKADEVGQSGGSEDEFVAETQLQDVPLDEDSEEVSGDERQQKKSKTSTNKHRDGKQHQKTKTKGTSKSKDEDDQATKKSRKVDPLKHANFRKLNIKNKNSKANGRGGKRFSRR